MLSEQRCQRASKQIIFQQEFENASLLVFWKAMTTTSAKWWERCNNGRLTVAGAGVTEPRISGFAATNLPAPTRAHAGLAAVWEEADEPRNGLLQVQCRWNQEEQKT